MLYLFELICSNPCMAVFLAITLVSALFLPETEGVRLS